MTNSYEEYKRLNAYKRDKDFLNEKKVINNDYFAFDLKRDIITAGDAYNEDAIAQSIENILLTGYGERIFEPSFGCGLTRVPFQNSDNRMLETTLDSVINRIEQIDFRVKILKDQCTIVMDPDNNQFTIGIVFIVKSNYRVGVLSRTLSY